MTTIRKAGSPPTFRVDGAVEAPYETGERDRPLAELLDAARPRAEADHATVHSGDGLFRASIPLVDLRRGAVVDGRVRVPDAPTNCWNVKDVGRIEVTVGHRPDSIEEKAARREGSAPSAVAPTGGASDDEGAT